jgi:5-methylcytosine-specific restriction endonuclease McrA
MRSVTEWTGNDDDAAIPPRVKDRVAQKFKDCCGHCGRPIGGKLRAEYDHVIPLCIGGKHEEGNLALVCNECHSAKTKLDVKIKAKIARVRKRKLGIRKPSKFACSRSSKWKKKISGEVILREAR